MTQRGLPVISGLYFGKNIVLATVTDHWSCQSSRQVEVAVMIQTTAAQSVMSGIQDLSLHG